MADILKTTFANLFSDMKMVALQWKYYYEFTKAVCNFVNLSFEIRSDHLKSVNQIL